MGLLSGLPLGPITLKGDASLELRPMQRITKHLLPLGCQFLLKQDQFLPALILPSKLTPAKVTLEVASAQVKSAVILAALKSSKTTTIIESLQTRNHTELLLQAMGCELSVEGNTITVSGKHPLKAQNIVIPGDLSSAAFFIVAALIVPGSEINIKNCGINPTRTGILTVLDQIGADYQLKDRRYFGKELVCDLVVRYTNQLKPFVIGQDLVPLLIDEIPILTLLATQITGDSIITGALELRVKETDRITAVKTELSLLGAKIDELPDGLTIHGPTKLRPGTVNSYQDHRLSMMLKVARLLTDLKIIGSDADAISYPNFEADLAQITVI
jgi:3-phosphoshikimate 1-carboxyvinyltransferase